MKQKFLIGAAAIALAIGGAASALAADAQNTRITHNVVANNPSIDGYSDNYSTRTNTLNNGSFNGAAGISHSMQNNGSNNAVSAADVVALNPQNATLQSGGTRATVSDNTTMDMGRLRSNSVNGAYQDVRGMFSVQQNNGDNNSMAASNQVLVRTSDDPLNMDTATTQNIGGSNVAESIGSDRRNSIQSGSFNGARGILNIQQNNGDNNAMAQTNVVAVGTNSTSLDQKVSSTGRVGTNPPSYGSTAYDTNVTRNNTLSGAFQGAAGIIGVQQNNGNNNVMASTTAVGVTIGALGTAAQRADLNATVGNAYAVQQGSGATTLTNTASSVMTNARGVMTLQQNNGNNNVMQSVVMVSANVTR